MLQQEKKVIDFPAKALDEKKKPEIGKIALPRKRRYSCIKNKEVKMLDYLGILDKLGYKVFMGTDLCNGHYSTVRKTITLPAIETIERYYRDKGYTYVSLKLIDRHLEKSLLKGIFCVLFSKHKGTELRICLPKGLLFTTVIKACFTGELCYKLTEEINGNVPNAEFFLN